MQVLIRQPTIFQNKVPRLVEEIIKGIRNIRAAALMSYKPAPRPPRACPATVPDRLQLFRVHSHVPYRVIPLQLRKIMKIPLRIIIIKINKKGSGSSNRESRHGSEYEYSAPVPFLIHVPFQTGTREHPITRIRPCDTCDLRLPLMASASELQYRYVRRTILTYFCLPKNCFPKMIISVVYPVDLFVRITNGRWYVGNDIGLGM
jgi:hypothetical protein